MVETVDEELVEELTRRFNIQKPLSRNKLNKTKLTREELDEIMLGNQEEEEEAKTK